MSAQPKNITKNQEQPLWALEEITKNQKKPKKPKKPNLY